MSNLNGYNQIEHNCNKYEAFGLLYDQYAPKAYGFILEYSTTKEQAEELLVDVFWEAWRDFDMFIEHPEKKILKLLLQKCRHPFNRMQME